MAGGGPAGEQHPEADPGALLVRRILHDLASPVGALAVALELAPVADPVAGAAVAQLTTLIGVHRSLFGLPPDSAFDPASLAPLLGDRALEVEPGLDARTARALAALALDAAQLVATHGVIRLLHSGGSPALTLAGRVRAPGAALAAVLAGAPATEAGTVSAAHAVRLLGPFATEAHPDRLTFRAAARQ